MYGVHCQLDLNTLDYPITGRIADVLEKTKPLTTKIFLDTDRNRPIVVLFNETCGNDARVLKEITRSGNLKPFPAANKIHAEWVQKADGFHIQARGTIGPMTYELPEIELN